MRYQRRSPLLQHLVEMAGVLLAGRGGARLLQILKVPLSRTSVLFHLMRLPLPSAAVPRVLGVDDFALYADVYGTLLVDADTRLPIELWAGRDAEQLAAWLRTHPGVEVVCRDGSPVYRQGIADGAPDAVQVSDRFHLWQGLSKRVGDIAAAHRGCLPAAVPEPEPAPPSSPAAPSDQAETPARRHAKNLFEAVHAVTDTGRSLNAAARDLGLNRRTVRKYARAANWQECVRRTRPRRPTSLDPYLDYLRQRWEEGEHTATVLHQESVAKGYRGHYQRVKMAIAPLRRGLPIDTPRERPPSPRQDARWITTAPSRRSLHATEAQAAARALPGTGPNPRPGASVRRHAQCLRRRRPPGLARAPHNHPPPGPGQPGQGHPRGPARSRAGHHHPVQLRRQRRPHHRPETPETAHGRPRRSPTAPSPRHPHGLLRRRHP
ncbi:transposase [Streptomyces sp. NPDC019645]|uniref:transposase n=1 Tax=Streptomyces sp. NPDC019645 TaxID=3154786 RepID=UPI0033E3212A